LLHAFAKKGTKASPYLSEPHSFTTSQVERKEEEKEKQIYNKGKMRLEQFLISTNQKFAKSND
jgi:hypothetical protein